MKKIYFKLKFLNSKIYKLYLFFILTLCLIKFINKKDRYKRIDSYKNNIKKINYNNKFAIIKRNISISTRGLMAYYFINLGCVIEQIYQGFIPILDLATHPNIFNNYNKNNKKNPWELFFEQPFNYTLENVIKNVMKNNIKYVYCERSQLGPHFNLLGNEIIRNYWKTIAIMYIPIKKKFIIKANLIRNYLFNSSNNILGILIRGTDYITKSPIGHPIQPKYEVVIKDIIEMDNKYKYDFYFLTTEDELIREKVINKFNKNKLKFIKGKTKLNYNYKKKEFLGLNNNIKGNINYMEDYLINIIILSKCLDIIASRTGGSIAAFILSEGFRNSKIYNLGFYKK